MRNSLIKTILVVVMIISSAACSKVDTYSGPCGDEKQWKAHKETLQIITSHMDTDSVNTITFEDTQEPNDICPDEHATITFHAATTYVIYFVGWRGKAYWHLFADSKDMGTSNPNTSVTSKLEVGLKQAYPSGPGFLGMQLAATFKGSGVDSLDRIKLKEAILDADITLDYRVYK